MDIKQSFRKVFWTEGSDALEVGLGGPREEIMRGKK